MAGRGSFTDFDPDAMKRKLAQSDERITSEAFEQEVSDLLNSFLSNFNDRDVDGIRAHLEEITDALGRDIDGTLDLLFGGSIEKHTFVDGLSDVDSLVLISNSELHDSSPSEVRDYFVQRLKERFPKTEIVSGELAVTVKFSDIDIQLLPALKVGATIKITRPGSDEWASINPAIFHERLTAVNRENGSKVVPVIKLVKGIVGILPESHRLSGYHIEALAVRIFSDYAGRNTPGEMIKHFFHSASEAVLKPLKDTTGQSFHVDSSLGSPMSLQRVMRSDALARIYRRINNANISQQIDSWANLFEDN